MAAPENPESHAFRQMRNDVDDSYELLKSLGDSINRVSSRQRLHDNRFGELQQTLDIHTGRLDRMEDNQRRQGERLGRMEGRLDGVEDRLTGVDGRLAGIADTQQQILDLLRGRPTG